MLSILLLCTYSQLLRVTVIVWLKVMFSSTGKSVTNVRCCGKTIDTIWREYLVSLRIVQHVKSSLMVMIVWRQLE